MTKHSCTHNMNLAEQLLAAGFVGGEKQLDDLVCFLDQQEIEHVHELAGTSYTSKLKFSQCQDLSLTGAQPAAKLMFAELLSDYEMEFLQRLIDQETIARRIRPKAVKPEPAVQADEDAHVGQVLKRSAEAVGVKALGGPTNAAKRLCESLDSAELRDEWAERARMSAIMDGCKKSVTSMRSGVRCYIAFAKRLRGKADGSIFPPSVNDLLVWSTCFRCEGTFSNYMGYVRTWCLIESLQTAAFDEPAVRRAKASIRKRGAFTRRKKMFLQLDIVRRIVIEQKCEERYGLLFLLAYTFLLRLPSEALPTVCSSNGKADSDSQTVLYFNGEVLCLQLKSRKNKLGGSLLERRCWCKSCPQTCPVHVLWPKLLSLGSGTKIFSGISPSKALTRLRCCLSEMTVPEAKYYRTHDLRRGHAKDLFQNGATLYEILSAGEWRSPAFLSYLDYGELESGVVWEAHADESSSEDEEAGAAVD